MALSERRTSVMRSLPWSVMKTLPFGSQVFCTGVLSWLGPKPVTPRTAHDDALVALVGDEDVAVRQPGILHRRIELVGAEASHPPNCPYCQTMLPLRSTRITRLSTQPFLQFLVTPGGCRCPT